MANNIIIAWPTNALNNQLNVNASWNVLQTWLDRTVLENFEPNLRFYDMWEKPARATGYNTLAWTRVNRTLIDPATATLDEWITPDSTDITVTTITLNATQYGLYATISDILEDVSPIPMVQESLKVLGQNMARIIDEEIQETLDNNASVTHYFANWVANRAAVATPATWDDIAKCATYLADKSAPMFWNGYIAVTHPNVIYDLMMSTTNGGFMEVSKYTEAGRWELVNWEIWMMYGVRFVKSPFAKIANNWTNDVYLTYIFGQGAYWVADLQSLTTYLTAPTASDSDPLAQRRKCWCKVAFGTVVLQPTAMVIYESTSTLDATTFNWN